MRPLLPTYHGKVAQLIVQPDDGVRAVVDLIRAAERSIRLKMFELTNAEIITALVHAKTRGVEVEVLLNQVRSSGARNLGIDVEQALKGAPEPTPVAFVESDNSPKGLRQVHVSPALSMDKPAGSIKGRKVAMLIDAGVDAASVKAMKGALNDAGAVVHLVAMYGGSIETKDGSRLPIDKPSANAASVLYDAVVVAGGRDPAKMAAAGLVQAFLSEAFKFGKAIAALSQAGIVVEAARLPGVSAKGAPDLGVIVGDDVVGAFIEAMMAPRFRNRDVDSVAA